MLAECYEDIIYTFHQVPFTFKCTETAWDIESSVTSLTLWHLTDPVVVGLIPTDGHVQNNTG